MQCEVMRPGRSGLWTIATVLVVVLALMASMLKLQWQIDDYAKELREMKRGVPKFGAFGDEPPITITNRVDSNGVRWFVTEPSPLTITGASNVGLFSGYTTSGAISYQATP